MRDRPIAGTDISVSEVGFGVWTVSSGWWGEFTDEQAVSLLRQARDLVKFISYQPSASAEMKDEVKKQGLWAAHLPPEMGGLGFGQVKLGLMHEILGQTAYGPSIFGNNAPDSGNAELLAVGGTEQQKKDWMEPLLDGRYRSCFSMTEPGAGADPTLLTTSATLDGDEWVINGHKWFSSNASVSDFLLVMARTGDAETSSYKSFSMFIVPKIGRAHV